VSNQTASAKGQILDAAEALFARKGYDATTIKAIGAASGLNPALLYYYFAGKEELYKAVLQRMVGQILAQGGALLDGTLPPAEAIRRLLTMQGEWLLKQPNLPRLLVRELLDHDARHAQEVILQMAAGPFQRLCRVIEQGQKSGAFRTDVEPRFGAVSAIAQVAYFMIAKPAVGIFFGQGIGGITDQTAREFARHAGDFAVRALSPTESAA
jgi:AcrR family transcriptional regulator